jgi:polyphosphate kinase 2 (PPK2 family)
MSKTPKAEATGKLTTKEYNRNPRAIVVFEGRGGAGKGGTIESDDLPGICSSGFGAGS